MINNKPLILSAKFEPKQDANRMSHVGDVVSSRKHFLENRPTNLDFLLENRYSWMNKWIPPGGSGLEVGCGNGLSKLYIKADKFLVTDFTEFDWVDLKVDALNMPFENESLDYVLCSNMIHHLAKPHLFFTECKRVLKPGGVIIIQEINASFFMRLILRLMNHEGYNFDVDPYNKEMVCNNPEDLWSGNNAIPNLLFDDVKKFESAFQLKFLYNRHTEFSIFLISGGVTAKVKTINLPRFILNTLRAMDSALIFVAKNIFALQKQIVLQKVKSA